MRFTSRVMLVLAGGLLVVTIATGAHWLGFAVAVFGLGSALLEWRDDG